MKISKKQLLSILSICLIIFTTACSNNKPEEPKKEAPKAKPVKYEYLSEDNMGSTEGLHSVVANGFSYYTDVYPDSQPETNAQITSNGKGGGSGVIMTFERAAYKDFGVAANQMFEEQIKIVEEEGIPDYPNIVFEITEKNIIDDTLRGIKIKRAFSTVQFTDPSSGIEFIQSLEIVFAPAETGMLLIALSRMNNSTEFDQTFNYICDTIYGSKTYYYDYYRSN